MAITLIFCCFDFLWCNLYVNWNFDSSISSYLVYLVGVVHNLNGEIHRILHDVIMAWNLK